MTEAWLLTSTFYGNWLPGDKRGFVARVWEKRDGEADADTRREMICLAPPTTRISLDFAKRRKN